MAKLHIITYLERRRDHCLARQLITNYRISLECVLFLSVYTGRVQVLMGTLLSDALYCTEFHFIGFKNNQWARVLACLVVSAHVVHLCAV